MRRPILNHLKRGELVYEPFLESGIAYVAAAELAETRLLRHRTGPQVRRCNRSAQQTLSGETAKLEADGRSFEEIAVERRKGAE